MYACRPVVHQDALAVAVGGFEDVVRDRSMAFEEFHLQVLQSLDIVEDPPQVGDGLPEALWVIVAIITAAEPILTLVEEEVPVEVGQRRAPELDIPQVPGLPGLAVHRFGREIVEQDAVVDRLIERHADINVGPLRQRVPLVAVDIEEAIERRGREVQ